MTAAPTPGPLPPGRTRAELLAEVTSAMSRVPAGAVVVLAVSGGPDSTACAFLVTEARPDLVPVLAHVRHGLRDDRRDLAVVRTQADWLGADLEVAEVVVEAAGRGVEAAARTQRYAALRRIARAREAGWLVVGHTADDQAETLVLRLARGTGVPGLGGMPPVRGDVIRPLLRLRRQDVHAFVELEGLPFTVDPTNRDRRLRRNAVRLGVMPELTSIGPDVVGALARLADLARDDARALDVVAAQELATVVRRVGPVVAVPRAFLADGEPAITRRAVRALVLEVRGGIDPPSAAEVETIRHLDDAAVDLAGITASAAGGWTALGPADPVEVEPCVLTIPGTTPWSPLRWWLVAATPDADTFDGQLQLGLAAAWRPPSLRIGPDLLPPGADPAHGQVVLGGLPDLDTLVLRTRLPGDRITTAAGTRKLADVYVDAGVPRVLRDLVPVVTQADRLLWVPGLAVDHDALMSGLRAPQVHLAVTRSNRRSRAK